MSASSSSSSLSVGDVFLQYVCPSMGCLMASVMFAAPVRDLRRCLLKGYLGPLNPFPWVMMSGNCLGWVVYGYYMRDAFVVAANLPGLIVSLWLNMGAAKLQYLDLYRRKRTARGDERPEQHWDASSPTVDDLDDNPELAGIGGRDGAATLPSDEDFVMAPQERSLLRVLCAWAAVIVWVGWFSSADPAVTVGIVVNANLIFFYGAPLQTVRTVISEGNCNSIHLPTMMMSCTNTSFWIAYGLVSHQFAIVVPNGIGLVLGILQALLCLLYPRVGAGRTLVPGAEPVDDGCGGVGEDNQCVDSPEELPPEEEVPVRSRSRGDVVRP